MPMMRRTSSFAASLGSKTLEDALADIRATDGREEAALDALDEAMDQVVEESMGERRGHIDIEAMVPIKAIGVGGQGGVWLAEDPVTGRKMAVKQVRKQRLASLPRKSAIRIMMESECLQECGQHPFITAWHAAFQNADSLFLALELATGGDLMQLNYDFALTEAHSRFYFACLSLAMRHLHRHGWLYRDVKLENVVIRRDGYAMLCDCGYAVKANSTRTFTYCGTDEYASPELLSGAGRAESADWWAMGVLLHELFTGHAPFEGRSPEEVFGAIKEFSGGGPAAEEKLLTDANSAHKSNSGVALSEGGQGMLQRLLAVQESERMGSGRSGFVQIVLHPWCKDVDWDKMLAGTEKAPWVPSPEVDYHSTPNFEVEQAMAPAAANPTDALESGKMESLFRDFGPTRVAPWDEPR